MKKREDLSNKKFNKLLCIKQDTASTYNKWICLCDCGNTKSIHASKIKSGWTVSCGCMTKNNRKVSNILNEKFNKLTVISRSSKTSKSSTNIFWNCLCECGNLTIVSGYKLKSGSTKSCGCLTLLGVSNPVYPVLEAAARLPYLARYQDMDFQDYFKMAQQDCYYCGLPPHLKVKAVRTANSKTFVYNTLDRLDSLLLHTKDNCVPSCMTCNVCKNIRALKEFKNYLFNISNHVRENILTYRSKYLNIDLLKIPKIYECYSRVLHKQNYMDGNLQFDDFRRLILMDCYYCGSPPLNKKICNKKHTLYWNGLDRILSKNPDGSRAKHDFDNIIPCCKYCNFAKSDKTLKEFYDWISRVKIFNKF